MSELDGGESWLWKNIAICYYSLDKKTGLNPELFWTVVKRTISMPLPVIESRCPISSS
jgi:hypothetical protein